jgi:hypothetical protein
MLHLSHLVDPIEANEFPKGKKIQRRYEKIGQMPGERGPRNFDRRGRNGEDMSVICTKHEIALNSSLGHISKRAMNDFTME